MAKPSTLPRWATDAAAPLTEPTEGRKDLGFLVKDKPPAQVLNWLLYWLYQWTSWANTSGAAKDEDNAFAALQTFAQGIALAATKTIKGNATDGATAVGVILDTLNALANAGAKLVSVRNQGTEKLYVDKDGNVFSVGGIHGVAAAVSAVLKGNAADGATAVGAIIDNAVALANAGAKALSIRVNGVEKAFFDKDGKLAAGNILGALLFDNLPASNYALSSSCGSYSQSASAYTDVTNLSVSLTTHGRPVMLLLVSDGSGNDGGIQSLATNGCALKALRGSTEIGRQAFVQTSGSTSMKSSPAPFFDVPAAGTYTYKVQLSSNDGVTNQYVRYCKLLAIEL